MSQKDSIEYPPGVRDLTEDISTDDLVRRLKVIYISYFISHYSLIAMFPGSICCL